MNKFDVAIVGMGPGGIFTALELLEKKPNLKIVMLDKGKALEQRKRVGTGLTCGWAGAGGFSDGKVIVANPEHNYGGEIQKYIKDFSYFKTLSQKVVDTHMKFYDKDIPIFGVRNEEVDKFELNAARNGMQLLLGQTLHVGTDRNYEIMNNMYNHLKDKIDIRFDNEVRDFTQHKDGFFVYTNHELDDEVKIECKYLVMMPGRSGNKWFENLAIKHGLTVTATRVDIGCRVEYPSWVTQEVDKLIYEPKLIIRTEGGSVRTFCHNPRGEVVRESIKDADGTEVWTANGHSNSEDGELTENTNTALLVSAEFTHPFNAPNSYGLAVARLCNLLAGDNGILVQRLKDLKDNRRSTDKRMTEMNLQPTLKEATAGDLRYAFPSKQLSAILEALEILDKVFKGINSDDTILYGPEIKWFSARVELNTRLESEIENMYVGGDTGCSRGIMQAAMSGLVIANGILEKIKMIQI